ncbi:hypothetical protein L3Y34_003939 [Caenorhabditis briggsae]|uniref:7TM GPCR serpentine receptor class x (Srx) domain-containing protein n=1 Tax=Caenorhabditis briggsae TaxID=6238 RepID=A0AAE9AEH3_CAEBR|nr:hypothetical protein L3Y34_003939 [Caenorhabditis briggsae]
MMIYEAAAQLNFINSVNRFFAVHTIFLYDRIFSNFKTYIMINLSYLISISMCTVFYEILGCYLYFEPKSWIFSYPETDYCTNLTWYCDFIFNIVLVVSTSILNLLASYKARKLHQRIMALDQNMMSVQRQRDINFIRQSFFQGLSMCVALIFYHITAPLITNEVLLFLDASLWAFMLAFEGGIILLSNREILIAVKNKKTEIASSVFVLDMHCTR